MKTIIAVIAVAMLTGCAVGMRPDSAAEVRMIPNDCSNKAAINRYLEEQSNKSKPIFQSQEDYEANRAAIRARLWELREKCQPGK